MARKPIGISFALLIVGLSNSGLAVADALLFAREELMSLPVEGQAWRFVQTAALAPLAKPRIADPNDLADVNTLAKALVGVRTGNARLLHEARRGIMMAIGTEKGGEVIGLARNLAPYVIAADVIGLDGDDDVRFRAWLRTLRREKLGGRTLATCHEDRPNNWGTMAGASRIAVAIYLDDQTEIDRAAEVFRGWLGDRAVYSGFKFGGPEHDLSWQVDPLRPVGINPKSARKQGQSIDGALPEEMRRGGSFRWPPAETGYCWEALQGAFVQAELLHRRGRPVYGWEDQALRRSVEFLYRIGWPPDGDDEWLTWIINRRYGANYPLNEQARPGKIMGWTSWLYGPQKRRD